MLPCQAVEVCVSKMIYTSHSRMEKNLDELTSSHFHDFDTHQFIHCASYRTGMKNATFPIAIITAISFLSVAENLAARHRQKWITYYIGTISVIHDPLNYVVTKHFQIISMESFVIVMEIFSPQLLYYLINLIKIIPKTNSNWMKKAKSPDERVRPGNVNVHIFIGHCLVSVDAFMNVWATVFTLNMCTMTVSRRARSEGDFLLISNFPFHCEYIHEIIRSW